MLSEKIDLLMRITNVTNSTLGKAMSFDASYISLIRRGKRSPGDRRDFCVKAGGFFAGLLDESICQSILASVASPYENEETGAVISDWLSDDAVQVSEEMRALGASGRSDRKQRSYAVKMLEELRLPENRGYAEQILMIGDAGKQKSVLMFLESFEEKGLTVPVSLYTDEDCRWLYEDETFLKNWLSLIEKLLSRGIEIKMIFGRNVGTAGFLNGCRVWIPLLRFDTLSIYSLNEADTGSGLTHGSLFLAKGMYSIVSHSVGNQVDTIPVQFFTDPGIVRHYDAMFETYLKISVPVVRSLAYEEIPRFCDEFRKKREEETLFSISEVPALFLLSDRTIGEMEQRCGYVGLMEKWRRFFARCMSGNRMRIIDIIRLPDPEELKQENVSIPFKGSNSELGYAPEEYAEHLLSAVSYAEKNPEYRLILLDRSDFVLNMYLKDTDYVLLFFSGTGKHVKAVTDPMVLGYVNALFRQMTECSEDKTAIRERIGQYVSKIRTERE